MTTSVIDRLASLCLADNDNNYDDDDDDIDDIDDDNNKIMLMGVVMRSER